MDEKLSPVCVIDADTHLTEPLDLWQRFLPSKFRRSGPQVEIDPDHGVPRWQLDGKWLTPIGQYSAAGWKEFSPSVPRQHEEINPACYDPIERLKWMDTHGVYAQVLYPNIVAFEGHAIMALRDEDLKKAIIRAYNDYLLEFSATDSRRFIPIAALPFWDVEASIEEMTRCRENGHRGILWASTMEKHGLPDYTDEHWDRFYAAAQDMNVSINFHVGVGETSADTVITKQPFRTDQAPRAEFAALTFMSNARTIAHIIMSGLCDRFPRLNFVSVESGFGYIPFLLESLNWSWMNGGAQQKGYSHRLMPSDYFRRQIYTMYWFEQDTLPLLELYPDNVMFETDFPHKTSLSPGPGSAAPSPRVLIDKAVTRFGEELMRKVLQDNAARVYGLELPKP